MESKALTKTEIANALSLLTLDRKRQLGHILGLAASIRSDRKHPTADVRVIAENLMKASMQTKEKALYAIAPALRNPDMVPAVQTLARLAFHDYKLIEKAIKG